MCRKVFDAVKLACKVAVLLTQALIDAVFNLVRTICSVLGLPQPEAPQFAGGADVWQREAGGDREHHDHGPAAAAEMSIVSDTGTTVHRYASAPDPYVRAAVELGGLTPAQVSWLMSLSDEDLDRLAAAGPAACGKAAAGKRCGIVGLPLPRDVGAAPEDAEWTATERAVHESFIGHLRSQVVDRRPDGRSTA